MNTKQATEAQRRNRIVVCDIETISNSEESIRASLPDFDPSAVALGNAKKEEKVAEIIEAARLTYGDKQVADAALNPLHSTCAIIGLHNPEWSEPVRQFCDDEACALEMAWGCMEESVVDGDTIVGYGLFFFDLIYMVKRSWINGVKVPWLIYNPSGGRYPWNRQIVDLAESWKLGDRTAPRVSLNTVLKQLGLPPKTGTGAEFGLMWLRDRAAGLAYNSVDLLREYELAVRLGI